MRSKTIYLTFILLFQLLLSSCNEALYTDTEAFNEDYASLNSYCRSTTEHGFHEGSGTQADPYIICKAEHLDILRDHLIDRYESFYDKYYKVREDINYKGTALEPFYPIGDIYTYDEADPLEIYPAPNSKPFEGEFDGNGKTISGLYSEGEDFAYVGFFQFLGQQAVVKDLTLQFYYNLTGENFFVGGVAGFSKGTISNVNSYGVITGDKVFLAGLVAGYQFEGTINNLQVGGIVQSSEGRELGGVFGATTSIDIENITILDRLLISGSTVNSKVEGESYVGGIVGRAESDVTFTNIDNEFSLKCSKDYCGGLAGYAAYGIAIDNSNNNKIVDGSGDYTGGLVGYLIDADVTDSANNGGFLVLTKKVNGQNFVGGIAGYGLNSTFDNVDNDTNISCTAAYCGGFFGYLSNSTVEVFTNSRDTSAVGDFVGGVIGYAFNTALSDGSITSNVTGDNFVGGIIGYSEFDIEVNTTEAFGDISGADYVGGLAGQVDDGLIVSDVDISLGVDSNVSGANNVSSGIGKLVSSEGFDAVMDDFHVRGIVSGLTKVGGIGGGVSGITKLTNSSSKVDIDATTTSGGGIYGDFEDIYESSLVNSANVESINEITGNQKIGGVCGNCEDLTISNVTVSANISSDNGKVGGIAGYILNTQITNSSVLLNNGNNEKIQSSAGVHTGGIAGYIKNASIINTFVSDVNQNIAYDVIGDGDTGGLIGEGDNLTISRVYSTVGVQGVGNYIGGIVGELKSSNLSECYATGNMNEGATGALAGGIVGFSNTSNITNCFATGANSNTTGGAVAFETGSTAVGVLWDTDVAGASGSSALGTGESTAMMFSTNPYSNYDFATIWNLPTVTNPAPLLGTYPTLK